jgi:ABC-type antimicrobial peptide transport system permease subunit
VIFAGLAGVVAALYPARKAAKMDVLRAITVE